MPGSSVSPGTSTITSDRAGLRVAHVVARTAAEGPGARMAVWVQGCSLRCPGCCNPELFAASGGRVVPVHALVADFVASGAEGVTLLGGEPVDQPAAVTALAEGVRRAGGSVVLFSGYTRREVEARAPGLLDAVDVLIDGRYDAAQPEAGARRWIGSRNQGLHLLSGRYTAADFQGANTVELRWSGGALMVNGWPVR